MKKINWILILQGWTMLWVVLGHSYLGNPDDPMPFIADITYKFAYSFHMALFMLISGYLFYLTRISRDGKYTYGWIILDKLKRLGIPYVVFTTFAMVLKSMFASDMARPCDISIQTMITSVIYPKEGPLLEMWFVAALLWLFLLYPLWKFVLKSVYRSILCLIVLIIIQFYHPSTEMFCVASACKYAVFFFMGILLCKYSLIDKMLNNIKIVIATFVLGVIINIVGMHLSYFVSAIGGIALSISLSIWLDKKLPYVFNSFRDYTFQIFLIGIFAQILVKMIWGRIGIPYEVGFVLCSIFGIYTPVLISKLLLKINLKYLLISCGLK